MVYKADDLASIGSVLPLSGPEPARRSLAIQSCNTASEDTPKILAKVSQNLVRSVKKKRTNNQDIHCRLKKYINNNSGNSKSKISGDICIITSHHCKDFRPDVTIRFF